MSTLEYIPRKETIKTLTNNKNKFVDKQKREIKIFLVK